MLIIEFAGHGQRRFDGADADRIAPSLLDWYRSAPSADVYTLNLPGGDVLHIQKATVVSVQYTPS